MTFLNSDSNNIGVIVLSIFIASLPGVVVAFLSQYLQERRENQNLARLYASARRLLALEVDNNRATLGRLLAPPSRSLTPSTMRTAPSIWRQCSTADLLGYELPNWSFSRWERLEADTFAAFGEKELAGIDQMNRALKSITELYSSLVTLTAEDKAELDQEYERPFLGQ